MSAGVGESIMASDGDIPWGRGAAAAGSWGVECCEGMRWGDRWLCGGAGAWRSSGDTSSGYLRFRVPRGGVEINMGDRSWSTGV